MFFNSCNIKQNNRKCYLEGVLATNEPITLNYIIYYETFKPEPMDYNIMLYCTT